MRQNGKESYRDDPLEELGRRIHDGDRDAFRDVFRALHAPLARYARGITGDEDAAYDVLQDVFLKLWEKRDAITPHTSFKAMLYTMVRNTALNARRKVHRRTPIPATGLPAPDSGEATAEAQLEASDLHARMRRWIDDLPERRAEAFRLSRYAGLSHREIGLIMDVSERTVDTHILLALRYLKSRMDELEQRTMSS